MPCDTQFLTAPMDLGRVDRKILSASLATDGWAVTHRNEVLMATRFGASIRIDAEDASLTAADYQSRTEITRKVLASYARTATEQTIKRFGFSKVGETTLENGAVKLSFRRPMGMGGTLGKVGL